MYYIYTYDMIVGDIRQKFFCKCWHDFPWGNLGNYCLTTSIYEAMHSKIGYVNM